MSIAQAPKKESFLSTPVAVFAGAVLISLSILVSGGVIKIKGLSAGNPSTNSGQVVAGAVASPTTDVLGEQQPSGPVKVSVDDDPVLGDQNAPVTLIEFSDYECPFCKRHFTQVYPEIKKNYIDTGKVKLVYRDLPLSFHDPMATTEAVAANCVREQGGDTAYFKMHDVMFEKTTSNGNGLTKDNLYSFVTDLGFNLDNFKTCLESGKYSEEIKKDIADGSSVGATGTPTFFVGKSTPDGVIEGAIIVGAYPYSEFQTQIDKLLK